MSRLRVELEEKHDLLLKVIAAIEEGGWNVIIVSDDHPFKLKIFRGEESYPVYVFVYNLSDGGEKRPMDELRIQLKSVRLAEDPSAITTAPPSGYSTLILGYWRASGIFVGYDPSRHIRARYSASLQIKRGVLEQASINNGFSVYRNKYGELVVAFEPSFFAEYVRSHRDLHVFGASKVEADALEAVAESGINGESAVDTEGVPPERKTVLVSLMKKVRDSSFARRILNAYGSKCAMCGLQLRLVDASHIVPVEIDGSTDETSNGVCLCALHHRAYDSALVMFDDRYRVIVNEERKRFLKAIGQDAKMTEFIAFTRTTLHLPPAVRDRPDPRYVQLANEIRRKKFLEVQ